MELEEKLEAEAIKLANKLDEVDAKSDNYGAILNHYQTIKRMLDDETRRINSNQQMELEAKKLELEQDKVELESMQRRAQNDLEEEKLRQQKKSFWKDLGLTFAGGVAVLLVDLGIGAGMAWLNGHGDTLTSFQQKLITPGRFKLR